MLIYPAIDIKGGRVVRFPDGAGNGETVYAEDPVAQAEDLLAQGAAWLHVVDVDRAYATGGDNTEIIGRIARLDGARVQVGGNLTAPDQAQRLLDAGVARVVAGTAVLLDVALLDAMRSAAGIERLAVAVEVRSGYPWIRSTGKTVSATPRDLVKQATAAGVRTVLFRNLDRDGQLSGTDLAGAGRLVGYGADVIVAGGVADVGELTAARDAGLAGIIVGRALYEGRLTFAEALACLG